MIQHTRCACCCQHICVGKYTYCVLGVILMLRIKEAREARGWTQERLAEAMNTTQQTIQRWETGQTDVKSTQIKEISRALGMTVSFIMGVDNESLQPLDLTPDERDLLAAYRNMDAPQREMLLATARTFVAASEKYGAGAREDVGRAEKALR